MSSRGMMRIMTFLTSSMPFAALRQQRGRVLPERRYERQASGRAGTPTTTASAGTSSTTTARSSGRADGGPCPDVDADAQLYLARQRCARGDVAMVTDDTVVFHDGPGI